MARAQSCANHVQHIVCKSRAAHRVQITCSTSSANHVQHIVCKSRTAHRVQITYSTSCANHVQHIERKSRAAHRVQITCSTSSANYAQHIERKSRAARRVRRISVLLLPSSTDHVCLHMVCLSRPSNMRVCQITCSTDLLRQFYVLPHREHRSRADQTFHLHPVTVYCTPGRPVPVLTLSNANHVQHEQGSHWTCNTSCLSHSVCTSTPKKSRAATSSANSNPGPPALECGRLVTTGPTRLLSSTELKSQFSFQLYLTG